MCGQSGPYLRVKSIHIILVKSVSNVSMFAMLITAEIVQWQKRIGHFKSMDNRNLETNILKKQEEDRHQDVVGKVIVQER
jgi:hypothetical protein